MIILILVIILYVIQKSTYQKCSLDERDIYKCIFLLSSDTILALNAKKPG